MSDLGHNKRIFVDFTVMSCLFHAVKGSFENKQT